MQDFLAKVVLGGLALAPLWLAVSWAGAVRDLGRTRRPRR